MATEARTRNEPAQQGGRKDPLPNYLKYEEARERITKLVGVMDDQEQSVRNNRLLRYAELDIEAERKAGRIAPDELYVPQHIIDSNIRREQAKYVAYVSSARRAAIFHPLDDPVQDCSLIEADFTNRFRYDGWQLPMYRFIDGMQMNGYGVLEMVSDEKQPGHLRFQDVAYGDFGYSLDTRDIQSCEMVCRRYYFTKTQLLAMANPETWNFDMEETLKVIDAAPEGEINDFKETSLYKVEKIMFRVKGVVHVGWCSSPKGGDWLRAPQPLYLGRQTLSLVDGKWVKAFETSYPYYVSTYNITENTVLRQSKGRAYMDQDAQEAVTSLISSYVTAHRRASGLYFSKDSENDPNNDAVQQQNNFFRTGCLIDSKIKQFQLAAPGADTLTAIQGLAGMNMQENSQIDYSANNRKDSRKTATEIQAAQTESQLLSTIQLALFGIFAKQICSDFFMIMRSRILSGFLKVDDGLRLMYGGNYQLRPAGDTDVIEKQEKILRMQQTWPVVAQTGAAQIFLTKLLTLMFPEDAPSYNAQIQSDTAKTTLLTSVAHVLNGLIEDPSQLSPQAQQHIPEIQQLLQQIVATIDPKAAASQKQAGPTPQGQPSQSASTQQPQPNQQQ